MYERSFSGVCVTVFAMAISFMLAFHFFSVRILLGTQSGLDTSITMSMLENQQTDEMTPSELFDSNLAPIILSKDNKTASDLLASIKVEASCSFLLFSHHTKIYSKTAHSALAQYLDASASQISAIAAVSHAEDKDYLALYSHCTVMRL